METRIETKIKNPIPEHLRLAAVASFPNEDWPWWHRYGNNKLATVDPSRIPTACRVALEQLATKIAPFAGFWDLDFYGAGLHLMPAGTSLGQHVDATHHPQRPWRRVASLVYFLEDCEGGALIIGESVISPKANTAAMFPAAMLHEVREVCTTRRTLSLFAWEVDHGQKLHTSAEFTA